MGEELESVTEGERLFLVEVQEGGFLGREHGDQDLDAGPLEVEDLAFEPVAASGARHDGEAAPAGGLDPADLDRHGQTLSARIPDSR